MKTRTHTVDNNSADQRLDNFLIKTFKGVPKARIYRAIRKGEVRVNRSRAQADYRLEKGDVLRLPPLRVPAAKEPVVAGEQLLIDLELRVLLEDNDVLVIDKPAGLPVHGGTGIHIGLIEALRTMRPQARMLELVHRLDRDTSGCLLIAKKRSVLVALHERLKNRQVDKRYFALLQGQWQGNERRITAALQKNVLQSGERVVKVNDAGKEAITVFRPIKQLPFGVLVEANLLTGRTHQIRVHAAHMGHPIAGDDKYGDEAFNREMRRRGLKRLFLHSASIQCTLSDKVIAVCALLDKNLRRFI